jgi:DNA-binding CsgD family transcriptional regulator
MNHIVEEMKELMHYGMPRRSGRYPWGSGKDPYQHSSDFISRVEKLRDRNFTYTDPKTGKTYTGDTAIAKSLGLSTGEFRTEIKVAKDLRRTLQVDRAKALKADGKNTSEIGRIMGVRESTVRSWFDEDRESNMKKSREIADFLKARSKEFESDGGMIDVGLMSEKHFNVSKEKFDQALYLLKREGYNVYNGRVPQPTNPGQFTTQKVLCPPGTPHKDIYDYARVHSIKDYVSKDGGITFEKKFTYPSSMDSKRLMIRYDEDGGTLKDGIVELRRGVQDLSLEGKRYSQVRILVDGTHYIKGMAVYSDAKDWPDGVDVVFNTNKSKSKSMTEVLKPIKDDPDNPFGSAIKDVDEGGQYWYADKKTGERKLGLINKRADEGDWTDWKDTLPSQFLSKQSKYMAQKQLDLAKADKLAEYEEICSNVNPTIKKHLLQKFADECDSSAVHLKGAALPGQKYHVIIPINSLKDNEVYAPRYENGTKLALIRYPHAGPFEIPILTVNNKNKQARELLPPDVIDAIGINKKNADRLSGADFDGDTVMCIPTHDSTGRVKVSSQKYLDDLVGFDPKDAYPERPGMKYMKDPVTKKDNTQKEMGSISNLISDMTLLGADDHELARAVKHSMVVIDAAKHKLDYKKSEQDNNIAELKRSYQQHVDENGNMRYGGASTIISRSGGPKTIAKRQGSPTIDRETGKVSWKDADDLYYPERKYNKETGIVTLRTQDGKKITYNVKDDAERELYTPVKRVNKKTGEVTFTDKTGNIIYRKKMRTQDSTNMAETDDAMSLVSAARHPMEIIYADYANSMKALANKARKEMMSTGKIEQNKSAERTYASEVASLNTKLNDAELNKLKERAATRLAASEVKAKEQAGLFESKGDKKKASQQAVTKYRQEVGSVRRKDRNIVITDREWEAIQAGAISESKLKRILNNTDMDAIRERTTPRSTTALSPAKAAKARSMRNSNYTLEEIAKALGVSASTVSKYL